MDKNKVIKYIVIGTPLLIGAYLIYKYLSKPKVDVEPTSITPTDKDSTPIIGINYTQKNNLPFKRGDKGGYVTAIQRVLGITQDGKFGSETDSSVRKYQKKLGLKVDGIVGKDTWRSLFNADFPNEKPYTKVELDAITGVDKNPYVVEPTPKNLLLLCLLILFKINDMIIGLVALLISVLNSFFLIKKKKGKELEEKLEEITEEKKVNKHIDNKLVPTKLIFKGDDSKVDYTFPIVYGTKGLQIVKLQKLLLKYDSNILPKYGADGYFDTELANALSKLIGRGFVESQEDIDKIENLIKNEK